MLAVLCGSLLISRLTAEISQARWQALSEDEKQRLGSVDHWLTSLRQLKTAMGSLGEGLGGVVKQLKPSGRSGVADKIWVRPDEEAISTVSTATPSTTANPEQTASGVED